ncbi:MAG: hypothetical protein ACR2N2_03800 [Acidimicrobiia bacterium]
MNTPESRAAWRDIASAAVISAAAVFIAWTAFQGTVWAGETVDRYNKAGAARVESAKDLALLNQELLTDQINFSAYVDAVTEGNSSAAAVHLQTMRPAFRELVIEWEAAGGLEGATESVPFDDPNYDVQESRDAALENSIAAEETAATAREAASQRDSYAGLAALFALALFFVSVGAMAKRPTISTVATAAGVVVFAVSVVMLLFQDVQI